MVWIARSSKRAEYRGSEEYCISNLGERGGRERGRRKGYSHRSNDPFKLDNISLKMIWNRWKKFSYLPLLLILNEAKKQKFLEDGLNTIFESVDLVTRIYASFSKEYGINFHIDWFEWFFFSLFFLFNFSIFHNSQQNKFGRPHHGRRSFR